MQLATTGCFLSLCRKYDGIYEFILFQNSLQVSYGLQDLSYFSTQKHDRGLFTEIRGWGRRRLSERWRTAIIMKYRSSGRKFGCRMSGRTMSTSQFTLSPVRYRFISYEGLSSRTLITHQHLMKFYFGNNIHSVPWTVICCETPCNFWSCMASPWLVSNSSSVSVRLSL